jgi:cytoskeletal protein CcmA (bactofilin family)
VAGDLIATGGNVVVDGDISGDAMVAGGEVRISGAVDQDIYVGAGILLEGIVGENARIGGGNIEIAPDGEIKGNASIGGGEILMNGVVDGYLQASGGRVVINGAVGGDLESTSGSLELGPNALVTGNLKYTSSEELKRDPRARVLGSIERTTPAGTPGWLGTGIFLIWTAGLMLLAAVLVATWPGFYSRVDATLKTRFGVSLLLGLAGLIAIPIAAVILFITLVGIPIAVLTVVLFLALILVGYITANVALGDWALGKFKPDRASLISWRSGAAALSVLVIGIVGQIPVLGGLVMLGVLLAGIGGLALHFKHGYAGKETL